MREIDEDERREAIDEQRRNHRGCRCGNPDWPGSCPGPAFCPVHGEDEADEEDEEIAAEDGREEAMANGQFGVGA